MKRHQGTYNRKRKGTKVLAIEKEKTSRYLKYTKRKCIKVLAIKEKRQQGTGNRLKEITSRYLQKQIEKASRYL